MLQSMRNNFKGTIAFIIVGFLAFIMAASLVTLTGDQGGYAQDSDVVKVNDVVINERDLQIAIAQERQRLQAQLGDSLPAEFLSDERLRAPVLNSLIDRSVLVDKGLSSKMTVSDSELDALILQSNEFKIDGVFNQELFIQNVRRIGHTPVSYRQLLRESIVASDLQSSFTNTAFVTDDMVKKTIALSRQARDFSWIQFPLNELPEKMSASEEEIQAFYDDNKISYNTEEKVSIEYLEIAVDNFLDIVDISEEDVQQQYQQEIDLISNAVEREAAHIMIEADSDNASQRIEEVQQKLAAGEAFEDLVSVYSDDFGSKDNGGNLGFSSGETFPEAFEETLSELEVDGVSGAIEVDDATHFIKLVSVKENPVPTFEESKTRIESELKSLLAEEIYIEKITELKDVAYNADSLAGVAEQFNLTLKTTTKFSQAGGDEPVLSDRRVVNAAFGEQVLQQGFTEVLELTPSQTVIINLLEHEPVRTLSLDEKRNDIVTDIKLSKAKVELKKKVDLLLVQLNDGKTLEDIAEAEGLFVSSQDKVERDEQSIDRELVDHVFNLGRPDAEKAIISSTLLENNDYALLSLVSVVDADFDSFTPEEQENTRRSFARGVSVNEAQAWRDTLKSTVDIEYFAGDAP